MNDRAANVIEFSHFKSAVDNAPSAELLRIKQKLQQVEDQIVRVKTGLDAYQMARFIYKSRQRRNRFFSAKLFAEPAWDILLELYIVAIDQRRTHISAVCAASGVPDTTALRWIAKLESEGLIERREDLLDARRVWIQLSENGRSAMDNYFAMFPAEISK